jgi:hypothetical protein
MYWVIKNGVKMTAMPALGKTQDDQTIWQLAAFLYKARGINARLRGAHVPERRKLTCPQDARLWRRCGKTFSYA